MKVWGLDHTNTLKLGTYGYPPFRRAFRLSPFHINSHMHVMGITGAGKSKLLTQLMLELHRCGRAFTLLDPAGDLARELLAHLVARGVYRDSQAFERIVYLDIPAAERRGRYLPFNVLGLTQPDDVIASDVKEAFHRAWPELAQGAATFDTLLPDAVLLLVHNHLPLTALQELLINDRFREWLLSRETDPFLLSSFRNVYDRLRKSDQVQYAGSVLRRARQLTQTPILRHGLSQRGMALDFRRLMDDNVSTIINLAVANQDARRLLGCFLTVAAEEAAKSRAELRPEERGKSYHLVMDEFANFTKQDSKTLMEMLSQCRKYGLFCVMSHQNWTQADMELRGAMQNVRVKIALELGPEDAEYTARQAGQFDPLRVKHVVRDEAALERTHPVFASLPEQYHEQREEYLDLLPGQAYVSLSGIKPLPSPLRWLIKRRPRRLQKIRVQRLPSPHVEPALLAEVEAEYLNRYFQPASETSQSPAVPSRSTTRTELVSPR